MRRARSRSRRPACRVAQPRRSTRGRHRPPGSCGRAAAPWPRMSTGITVRPVSATRSIQPAGRQPCSKDEPSPWTKTTGTSLRERISGTGIPGGGNGDRHAVDRKGPEKRRTDGRAAPKACSPVGFLFAGSSQGASWRGLWGISAGRQVARRFYALFSVRRATRRVITPAGVNGLQAWDASCLDGHGRLRSRCARVEGEPPCAYR